MTAPRTLEDARDLFAYTDWANDRLCRTLYAAFGEETDLTRHADSRVRAIQTTAVHIVAAQAVWRERWEGRSPTDMLDPAGYPTPLALRMAFAAERARFWGWFAALHADAELDRVVSARSTRGEPRVFPLRQMLAHVVTHGCYHRGQIAARLLDMGREDALLDTDLIAYYQETLTP